jgi:hypothetical protein
VRTTPPTTGDGVASTQASLRKRVTDQIVTGALPREPARAVVASYGNGSPCDICGQATAESSVAYAMRLGSGNDARSAYVHSLCFELWDEVRKLPAADVAT